MNKNKNSNWIIVMTFAAISILIVTIITAFSAVLTLAIEQAQSLNTTEQKQFVTDVNVHFKAACVSVIVFTYCW